MEQTTDRQVHQSEQWVCRACTFVNRSRLPAEGCEICYPRGLLPTETTASMEGTTPAQGPQQQRVQDDWLSVFPQFNDEIEKIMATEETRCFVVWFQDDVDPNTKATHDEPIGEAGSDETKENTTFMRHTDFNVHDVRIDLSEEGLRWGFRAINAEAEEESVTFVNFAAALEERINSKAQDAIQAFLEDNHSITERQLVPDSVGEPSVKHMKNRVTNLLHAKKKLRSRARQKIAFSGRKSGTIAGVEDRASRTEISISDFLSRDGTNDTPCPQGVREELLKYLPPSGLSAETIHIAIRNPDRLRLYNLRSFLAINETSRREVYSALDRMTPADLASENCQILMRSLFRFSVSRDEIERFHDVFGRILQLLIAEISKNDKRGEELVFSLFSFGAELCFFKAGYQVLDHPDQVIDTTRERLFAFFQVMRTVMELWRTAAADRQSARIAGKQMSSSVRAAIRQKFEINRRLVSFALMVMVKVLSRLHLQMSESMADAIQSIAQAISSWYNVMSTGWDFVADDLDVQLVENVLELERKIPGVFGSEDAFAFLVQKGEELMARLKKSDVQRPADRLRYCLRRMHRVSEKFATRVMFGALDRNFPCDGVAIDEILYEIVERDRLIELVQMLLEKDPELMYERLLSIANSMKRAMEERSGAVRGFLEIWRTRSADVANRE